MSGSESNPAVAAGVRAAPSGSSMAINVVAFQIGWFACVLGAARDLPWLGTGVAAVIVAVHIARSTWPLEEMKLIAAAVLIGGLWDSLLAVSGLLGFHSGVLVNGVAPPWILAMYAVFATTLNVSLNWLHGRWLLAVVLGGVSGPLAYWAGARLGAVTMSQPELALGALAVGWAVLMPVFMALARRFDGVQGAAAGRA